MVDRDLVTRKLAMIVEDLRAVTPIAQKPLDAYLASATDEILAERYLERMIGRMIDVNYHLITDAGHAPPRDYYESFTELGKLQIVPPGFASQMAACAGLRNRIVHEYDDIDPRRIHEGLQAAVRDIPEYLAHVHRHIERASADPARLHPACRSLADGARSATGRRRSGATRDDVPSTDP